MKKVLVRGFSAAAFAFSVAGCASSTNYLHIITPHTAADLLADDVQVFEGKSYDEAAVQAAEAGYEVILSYEGRGQQGLFGMNASVRLIAKDADGIRPSTGKENAQPATEEDATPSTEEASVTPSTEE
ncbi:MAG: hypothetical protein LBG90_02840 [Spirochaetaceae bacterium]|jgi:hypothetical protein|nr:hypothetical protein [Spirochaetaceae bacterium]